MVDRQSVANDLNAIANAVTREEGLIGILDEIGVVCENINELIKEEVTGGEKAENVKESPEEDTGCGPCQG